MATIGSHRPMVLAQAGFLREVRAMFAGAARQIGGEVAAAAGSDGRIAEGKQRALKIAVGRIVSDLFTPGDNRSAYADDGVTPRSPYAEILNKWLALATFYAIQQQEAWLRAHIPADVLAGMRAGRRSWATVAEAVDPELLKMAKGMRLFAPNPNTRIDPDRRWVPPQKWTDDKGYRLSDRIWRVDEETRRKIDEVLTQALRDGTDAIKLSKMLSAYLDPTVTKRTDKPYNVSVNYAAMRLARTEISRAFNEAAYTAGLVNPYVTGYDVARSGNGDPDCPVCPQHATIDMSGTRVREPYPMEGGRQPPNHPHCMCVVRLVTADVKEVTAALRAGLEQARAELNINPADARAMTVDLLGNWGDPVKFGAGEGVQVGVRMTPAPVPAVVMRPEQWQTTRDAAVWFDKTHQINLKLEADVPVEALQQIGAEIDRLTQQFPEVTERLNLIQIVENLPQLRGDKIDAAVADANHDGMRIRYDARYLRSNADKTESPAYGGWTITDHTPIRATTAHEYGHMVHFWLDRNGSKGYLPAVSADGIGRIDSTVSSWLKWNIATKPRSLSEYSMTNNYETFAENFVAWQYIPKSKWQVVTKRFDALMDTVANQNTWTTEYRYMRDVPDASERDKWYNTFATIRQRLNLP